MLDIISAGTAFAMLGSQSIWDIARRCHDVLDAAGLSHAMVGGVAVFLHGYRRHTADVDLLVRADDASAVKQALERAQFAWDGQQKEFRGPEGIPVQFVLSDEAAGNDATYNVKFPDPSDTDSVSLIDGLPAVTLAKLIELKLACGLGSIRRTHKDFADVVELIAINGLGGEFARFLHKSVRPTYRKLVRNARGGQSSNS